MKLQSPVLEEVRAWRHGCFNPGESEQPDLYRRMVIPWDPRLYKSACKYLTDARLVKFGITTSILEQVLLIVWWHLLHGYESISVLETRALRISMANYINIWFIVWLLVQENQMVMFQVLQLQEAWTNVVLVEVIGSETINFVTFRRDEKRLLHIAAAVRTEIQMISVAINGIEKVKVAKQNSRLISLAVDSSKQRMGSFCLAYKAKDLILDNLSADKRCFSVLNKGTIYRKILHLVDSEEFLLVNLSISQPWDPGILRFMMVKTEIGTAQNSF